MGKTAFLFPGQGSQSVGMADHLSSFQAASEVFGRLDSDADRPGLMALVREGPEDLLTRTDNVQPSITAVNLATLAVLREAGIRADAAAGHSLGEYSALCAAGVLDASTAVRLTRIRGTLMQACAEEHPGAMAALIGATREAAEALVAQASHLGAIGVANINSEGQVVVSGSTEAVAAIRERAGEMGIRKVIPLKVSGAWHSPLMRPASAGLAEVLRGETFAAPSIPVVANVTAGFVTTGEECRSLLAEQVVSPVLWADSMRLLAEGGFDTFVEVGPGAVLQGLLKGFSGISVHGTATARALDETLERLGGN